jgi:hypothetical protein
MDRRAFISGNTVGLLAASLAAGAQESITRTRVGFLAAESPSTNRGRIRLSERRRVFGGQ